MKTLIITRHAKSDWSNLYQKDFDRELNHRGLHDAPMMGKRLALRMAVPDLILSSTAMRAKQTAELIAGAMGYDIKKIQWSDLLYHAPASQITEQIMAADAETSTLMIVCHNPGITHFVNMQCGTFTDNVPTCGMAAFEIRTDVWSDFPKSEKKLLFYDYPKNAGSI